MFVSCDLGFRDICVRMAANLKSQWLHGCLESHAQCTLANIFIQVL